MRTVTVYKTNVENRSKAETIVDAIRRQLPDCEASFDLEDCDNVLRVENTAGRIDEPEIHKILQNHGYEMETLL